MKIKSIKFFRIIAIAICFFMVFEQSGFAQIAGELDLSSHFLALRNTFIQDRFRPLHLRYLSYDPSANNFNLLLDKGDFVKGLSPKGRDPKESLQQETKTLLNYFFIGISLPNEAFWVNLRPDAADNIIDSELAETDVGKVLLEADLQLKKDTANFTSPQTPEGKEYWDKLYKKAEELYGSENITIPTLTRPWIVPDEIIIRESSDNAYVYKATLKVMLEQDYLKDSSTYNFKDERSKALNEYSSQLIRETIIPKLTKEINSSKRYAPLRQVYYSLILAQWFKQKFYGKSGVYSYLIDRHNLTGLTSEASWSKTTYFNAYKTSFQQGEYNIKEPHYTPYGQTIRSYMSGGIALASASSAITKGLVPHERNVVPLISQYVFGVRVKIEGDIVSSPFKVTIEAVSSAVEQLPAASPVAGASPVVIQDNLLEESEVINKVQTVIMRALAGQVSELRAGMGAGARVVNIGSTSRDTHIFEINSKEFDLDFMILFENQQDLESFENNYTRTLDGMKTLFESADFEIKHIGKVKNRAGDSKISYFINNGGSNFKLEVNLSIDKKIYADWFKEQESQILALGGDAELVKYDIKRMKRLVTQLGIYNIYEGGLGAVGIEQLVIQSAGYSEQGRRIEGVGSFHQALEWICRAGLNKTNEIISLKQAKKNFKVFDPETGEDLVNRLNENSWAALVGLAKEFSSRKGYGGYYGKNIECFKGKKQASAWDSKQINGDNVEGYIKRTLVFGSGHFATHIINSELLKVILQQGYLMPRVYVQHHMDLEGNGSRLAYPTEFLHFIIDSVLERWKDSKVAFFAAVEPLLEHKVYPYLPESGREWEVTGFSASAYDRSNRFYINELGIIFVPREWQEDKEFQELLSSLAYRPRIYYYEGATVQEGIKNFIEKYHIRPMGPSLLSGYVERVGHKDNKSVYANISPWSEDEKINMIDLPHTAEECAEIVLRVYSLPESKGYRTEIYQFARQAYELDPNSAKANLVKALYYPFYEPTPDKDSPTKIREVIDYLEKAIGLGLPEEYKFLALVKLIYYYRQAEDFDNMIKAKERYLNLENSSNQEHHSYKYAIKEAKENKKILDEFIQRVDKCRSLDDLSLLVKNFVPIPDYNMCRVAYKKFYETFKHLTNKALDKLYKNAMDKIFLEQEKAIKEGGYFAPYSIKDGIESGLAPLANSIGNLYKDFIEIVSQGVSKNEYEAQTYSYSADGIRYRFMSTIDPQIEKAKKEIIRRSERLLAERRLGDKIAVLNKEVYDETIDQDPKSIYNYFDGVRSQLEASLIILEEIKSAGGNTEKAEEQIGQFAKKAEAKIGAGLEKMGIRNFVKRFFDFVRGKEIVIPKNYKEILQSYLPSSLGVKHVNPAGSPVANRPAGLENEHILELTGVTTGGGRQYWERWNPENVRNCTLAEYVQKMKESSGHFAVHTGGFDEVLEDGYFVSRYLLKMFKNKILKDAAYPSKAVHFAIDQSYYSDSRRMALVCSLEALMENKAFLHSPFQEKDSKLISAKDFPTAGFYDDPLDISHRFNIDDLGILFVSESMKGQLEKVVRLPKRIYIYSEDTIGEAINNFISKNRLNSRRNVILSGELSLARDDGYEKGNNDVGSGRGRWLTVEAPWLPFLRGPQRTQSYTPEELCQMAENITRFGDVESASFGATDYANLLLDEAINKDPSFAKAYLLKGMVSYDDDKKKAYLEKALAMDSEKINEVLAKEYKITIGDSSRREYEYSVSEAKLWAEGYEQLGEIYLGRMVLTKATKCYRQAHKLYSKFGLDTGIKGSIAHLRILMEARRRVKTAHSFSELKEILGESNLLKTPNSHLPESLLKVICGLDQGRYIANILFEYSIREAESLVQGVKDAKGNTENKEITIFQLKQISDYVDKTVRKILERVYADRAYDFIESEQKKFYSKITVLIKAIEEQVAGSSPVMTAASLAVTALADGSPVTREHKSASELKEGLIKTDKDGTAWINIGLFESLLRNLAGSNNILVTGSAKYLSGDSGFAPADYINDIDIIIPSGISNEDFFIKLSDAGLQIDKSGMMRISGNTNIHLQVVERFYSENWVIGKQIALLNMYLKYFSNTGDNPYYSRLLKYYLAVSYYWDGPTDVKYKEALNGFLACRNDEKKLKLLYDTIGPNLERLKQKITEINLEEIGKRILSQYRPGSPVAPENSVSSPAKKELGGIDMRSLSKHTVIQPMVASNVLKQGLSPKGAVPVSDKEWQEIERMANSGMAPSCERLREYLLSLQDPNSQTDKVLACIADILRQEEEKACGTESSLREILVLLESDKPVNELRLALAKVQVLAKEPQLIVQ